MCIRDRDKAYAKELELAQAVKAHLEDGKMARTFEVSDDEDEQIWFKNYNLLTAKPTIYAANVAEDDLADDGASNPHVAKVRDCLLYTSEITFSSNAFIVSETSEPVSYTHLRFINGYLHFQFAAAPQIHQNLIFNTS